MAEELAKLIKEDNVEELSKILNSNEILRNNFNTFTSCEQTPLLYIAFQEQTPLLLVAVQEQSKRVVEYLLSQPFVDKTIYNKWGENIYHVICRLRGADQLFSIIERNVPHHLLLNPQSAFDIACRKNNIFIVKRVHEILKSLKVDFPPSIINESLNFALFNEDIEVAKYVLSIDGIQLSSKIVFKAIRGLKFDVVVYLLNVYLCKSIPSHLHNQFHIFQFSKLQNKNINLNKEEIINEFYLKRKRDDQDDITNHNNKKRKLYLNHNINNNNNNNNNNVHNNNFNNIIDNINNIINNNNINNNNNANNNVYLTLVEKNLQRLIDINIDGDRIWHGVCLNADINVVQLIFSLKGVQPKVFNAGGFNGFFICMCKKFKHKSDQNYTQTFPFYYSFESDWKI